MTQWTSYLMHMRQYDGYLGVAAKLVGRSLRGATPESMKRSAAKMKDADTWIQRVDDLEGAMDGCVTVDVENSDWINIGLGCHKRRNHITGAS